MSEAIRNLAEQSADPRSGSTVWRAVPERHDNPPRYLWWVWIVVVLGLLMVTVGIARAAEPGTRPYEITLHFPGTDYDKVSRTHYTLAVYESKEACRVAIVRVRVAVSGARLRCNPVEQGRVQ